MLQPVPEIGGVQEAELFGINRPHVLARLDDRLDQARRAPLCGHNVVTFSSKPFFEQLPLCGFTRTIRPFERNQQSAVSSLFLDFFAKSFRQLSRAFHHFLRSIPKFGGHYTEVSPDFPSARCGSRQGRNRTYISSR